MALSNVALFGGAFLAPVLVGRISRSPGWAWSFYFLAIFSGAALPLLFFLVPETAFRRSDRLNTDFGIDTEQSRAPTELMLAGANRSDEAFNKEAGSIEVGKRHSPAKKGDVGDGVNRGNLPAGEVMPKASFFHTLKLFN